MNIKEIIIFSNVVHAGAFFLIMFAKRLHAALSNIYIICYARVTYRKL